MFEIFEFRNDAILDGVDLDMALKSDLWRRSLLICFFFQTQLNFLENCFLLELGINKYLLKYMPMLQTRSLKIFAILIGGDLKYIKLLTDLHFKQFSHV